MNLTNSNILKMAKVSLFILILSIHGGKMTLGAVEVLGGFEGSNIYNITKMSDTYFTAEMKPDSPSRFKYPDHHGYWFYLKITGAKDKTITIDITNCDWMPDHWNNYKPVFSYASDPNNLSSHYWQRVTNTSRIGTTFSFTQSYSEDIAWVALRYPFMYTYLTRYLDTIKQSSYVKVESLTKTAEGRELYAITITDNTAAKPKKGIFIFARDHASEQDGSWLIQGIIKFLLSNDPFAISLLQDAKFFLIPMVKPDASYYGRTVDSKNGIDFWPEFHKAHIPFGWYLKSAEANAVRDRLINWQASADTLEIAINLHHPHGNEPNVWLWGGNSKSGASEILKLNHAIMNRLDNRYTTRTDTSKITTKENSGLLFEDLFTNYLAYEINMHAHGSFLELSDYEKIGEAFVKGIYDYFEIIQNVNAGDIKGNKM